MINIPRHKVFISYYHKDDQWYKDQLLALNEVYNLFDDYSVHEDEIDDTGSKITKTTMISMRCCWQSLKVKYVQKLFCS